MNTATLLAEIRAAGLTLDPAPDGLRVSPKARLTDELRKKIRAHKADLLAALRSPPDDLAELNADINAQAATADTIRQTAHPDRVQFAMRNHREAVLHHRRMARQAERVAAMHRDMAERHISAARARVDATAFDEWLADLEGCDD